MDIDGIMKMISLKDTGFAHNPAEMKLAIEKYAEAKRESMRQACIKACTVSAYNKNIGDVIVAIREIK